MNILVGYTKDLLEEEKLKSRKCESGPSHVLDTIFPIDKY